MSRVPAPASMRARTVAIQSGLGLDSGRSPLPTIAPYLRRAGKQEPARSRVGVHGHLDRAEELRSQLDLIDDQEAVVLDEAGRIIAGGAERGRVIQQADHRGRAGRGWLRAPRLMRLLPRALVFGCICGSRSGSRFRPAR